LSPNEARRREVPMRNALLLLVPSLALAACALPAPEDTIGGFPTAWRGTFAGSCTPGEVVVFLEERDGSAFSGTMYYEEETEARLRATYRVRAEVGDGSLRLTQAGFDTVDPLPNGLSWCEGTYDFSFDAAAASKELAGAYAPTNCS